MGYGGSSLPSVYNRGMFVVYLVTNRANGKQYVGKARDARERWKDHLYLAACGGGFALHAAIRKHGRRRFSFEVIEQCADETAAFRAEQRHIARLRTSVRGYNLTDGGEGCSGYKHTPESLKKMGDVHRGKPNSEEQKRKIAETLRGRVFTPEWKAKISTAKMGHEVSVETRAKLADAARGKSLSPESRAKVAEASRNRARRPWTDEQKKRMSEKLRGCPWSAERRAAQTRREE